MAALRLDLGGRGGREEGRRGGEGREGEREEGGRREGREGEREEGGRREGGERGRREGGGHCTCVAACCALRTRTSVKSGRTCFPKRREWPRGWGGREGPSDCHRLVTAPVVGEDDLK